MSDKIPVYYGDATQGEIELLRNPLEIEAAENAKRIKLSKQGFPLEWAQTGKVWADDYVELYRDPVKFPDNSLGTYLRLAWASKYGDGVAILPKLHDKIILIRHFRHATRQWHWEIPRGFGEAAFSSEDNARRELEEEIGAIASDLKLLGHVYPDSGLTGHKVQLFLARIDGFRVGDRAEGISAARAFSESEIWSFIAEGQITDVFTLSAIIKAKAQGYLNGF